MSPIDDKQHPVHRRTQAEKVAAERHAADLAHHRRRRDSLIARGEDPAEHYSQEVLDWMDSPDAAA